MLPRMTTGNHMAHAMVRIAHAVLVVLLVVACVAPAQGQDVTFTAGASSTQVAAGQQFQITFTLAGGSLRSYKDFRQPDMNVHFLTLMGPSTSQQMQIINGRVSTSISWTYVLQPRSTGTYTIPPASITYDGQTLKTNSLTIKVSAGAAGGGAQQQQQQQQQKGDAPDVNLGDNLFIRAIVDTRTVYVGEPVTVTYKLYSRVAFNLDSPIKLPRMVGFWSEDLESPTQLRPVVEVYNGKQYETYMMKKVVYFPTQAGDLAIEPFEINCTVQVRQKRKTGDDFYDRFFADPFFDSYQNVKKALLTEKIAVKVKPLPDEGRPASFNGAVGDFTMDVTPDRRKLTANDAVTLRIVIRGNGNLKLLEEPVVTVPGGIDRFDPTINEDITRGSGVIGGVKSFEYLLVPRYPGSFTVEPVEFSYFNPARKRYITLRSAELPLEVAPGKDGDGDKVPAYIGWQRQDVRPLLPAPASLVSTDTGAPAGGLFVAMYVLPLLALAGALVARRRYLVLHGDVTGMRMRRAGRLADKHLARSKSHLEAGRIDAYYLEIARALWGYTQHRLALPTSETSIDAVMDRLTRRGAGEDVATSLHAALERIEYARFSPTRASSEEMLQLYDLSKRAIIDTEQALKG